jgi:hypothetical protein
LTGKGRRRSVAGNGAEIDDTYVLGRTDAETKRLRDDVVSRGAIQMLPIMFGAWARKAG